MSYIPPALSPVGVALLQLWCFHLRFYSCVDGVELSYTFCDFCFYSPEDMFPTFKLLCEENMPVWFLAFWWVYDSSVKPWIGVVVKFEAGIYYDSQVPSIIHTEFILYFLMASLTIASLAPPRHFLPPLLFYTPFFFCFHFLDGVCSNACAGLMLPRTAGTTGCTPHRTHHAILIVIVTVLRGGTLRDDLARRTQPSRMDYCNSVPE